MSANLRVDAVFGRRDFGAGGQCVPGWQTERITWSAHGGPDLAWITRGAPAGGVGRWRDLLRCPVELFTPDGQRCWWGYVSSVVLEGGGGQMHLTLDEMCNTVICRYREFSGVTRELRVVDEASAALYGAKERLLDLGDSSALRAETAARALLRRRGGARSSFTPAPAGGAQRVRLGLRGWWHTLGWRLFVSHGQGSAAVEAGWSANAEINLGASSALAKCAQALVDDHGPFLPWKALEVEVCAQKVGSPGDTLQVSVYAVDASGVPVGSALDTAPVATTAEMQTVRASLHGSALVQPGTAFGLVFTRSGAVSGANYYRIGLREQAGLRYACRVWNGSDWLARSPQANALARVFGGADTSNLLGYYAAPERGGQFLTRVLAETPSGIDSAVYETRVRTPQREVEDLLDAGCADGRWMLAEITPGRVLRVYPSPPEAPLEVLIQPDGSLCSAWGSPLRRANQALGHWARYQAWPDAPPVLVRGCALTAGRLVITAAPGRGWPR
jgi:hypothetical protein